MSVQGKEVEVNGRTYLYTVNRDISVVNTMGRCWTVNDFRAIREETEGLDIKISEWGTTKVEDKDCTECEMCNRYGYEDGFVQLDIYAGHMGEDGKYKSSVYYWWPVAQKYTADIIEAMMMFDGRFEDLHSACRLGLV